MNRLPQLDGLRAISIILVLCTHMLPMGPKQLLLNEATGAMGMSLFFSLSGFLITSNLLAGQSVRAFFIRRFIRILPLAYAYLAFVFLLVVFDPLKLFGSLFFVENYVHSLLLHNVNGHFWSLCVEMHFYVAIGLCVLLLGRRGLWIVLPACLLVTLLRISEGAYINIKTHLRVDEILIGACVALLYHEKIVRFRASTLLVCLAVAGWFVSSWPFSDDLQYLRPYFTGTLLMSVIYLSPGWLYWGLVSRPAKYIAEVSYALYVFHPLTIYGWMNEGSIFERYALKRPVSFAVTFFLAHISTFYWERAWIALGKRITSHPTGNRAA